MAYQPDKPQQLTTIAVLQLVSGVINLFFAWWLAATAWGTVGTLASCGVGMVLGFLGSLVGCPLGFLVSYCGMACGAIGMLLIPIGALELVAGIMGLAQPGGSGSLGKLAAWAEVLSLLAGGLVSGVIGIVSLVLYRDPQVAGFLETHRP